MIVSLPQKQETWWSGIIIPTILAFCWCCWWWCGWCRWLRTRCLVHACLLLSFAYVLLETNTLVTEPVGYLQITWQHHNTYTYPTANAELLIPSVVTLCGDLQWWPSVVTFSGDLQWQPANRSSSSASTKSSRERERERRGEEVEQEQAENNPERTENLPCSCQFMLATALTINKSAKIVLKFSALSFEQHIFVRW